LALALVSAVQVNLHQEIYIGQIYIPYQVAVKACATHIHHITIPFSITAMKLEAQGDDAPQVRWPAWLICCKDSHHIEDVVTKHPG
jgi:hypothetical protein